MDPIDSNKSEFKLWSGRTGGHTSTSFNELNRSLSFDFELWREDIEGSKAHATMLAHCNIISPTAAERILKGLEDIESIISSDPADWLSRFGHCEDIHSAVEAHLTELVGEDGKRLHTGRSRNDQVALDLHLWLKGRNIRWRAELITLRQTLLNLASRDIDIVMPGYTHLQHAQPLRLSQAWLAHQSRLARDTARLNDCFARVNISPLGAGALAGSGYPIDPNYTAQLLKLAGCYTNSLDAVSDRDFVCEHLFSASTIGLHLSQLGEELVLWSSDEFGLIVLPNELSSGSSMMPQKKNPDLPELLRAKTGRLFGNLQAMLIVLKGLPLSYNKDLQEDKECIFDTAATLALCLPATAELLTKLTVNTGRMEQLLKESFVNATDAADYLVQRGVAFRDAYRIIGEAVGKCIAERRTLQNLDLDEWKAISPNFDDDIVDFVSTINCIERRAALMGTSTSSIAHQLESAQQLLAHDKALLLRQTDDVIPGIRRAFDQIDAV